MNKEQLRDALFSKYFDVEEGISVIELVKRLSFITEKWDELRQIISTGIDDFDTFGRLDQITDINYNENNYLIVKFCSWDYLIIDIDKRMVLEDKEVKVRFCEEFFIDNFDEFKVDVDYFKLYYFSDYTQDISPLVEFYFKNKEILSLSSRLYYRLDLGKAWTYFSIDFINHNSQLCFQTPDQFLYEQLFLKDDLTPAGMQDAQSKIGIERMREMFEKIKLIKIPKEVIPNEWFSYLKEEIDIGKVKKL